MEVIVRPATEHDIDVLVGIETASYPEPWSAEVFRERLGDPQAITLVAEVGGTVGAYATATVALQHSQLLSIAVDPELRRHRVGRVLLIALADRCSAAGASQMRLEVRASNTAARRLYESISFRLVGLRPRYYGNEDAAIMAADLTDVR